MSSLDDIKKKLNIEEMDRESRKKMFNKFVEKGGKVVEEKTPPNKSVRLNRTRQVEINKQIQNRENELINKYDHTQSNKTYETNVTKKIKYPLKLFLKGFIQGYFTLSGQLKKKYSQALDTEFQDILSGLNFVCSQILNLDNEEKWEMVDYINKNFSYSYELIMRIYDLYKLTSINQIQNYVKTENHIQCTSILRNIHLFYKDLIILYPYWETNKEVLWRALGFYEKLTGKHSMLSKAKIYKYIDRLFTFYLPFFHIILCYNLGDSIPYEYDSMKEFAQISDDEIMGIHTTEINKEKEDYIEALKKEKEESLKKLQETVAQREMERIPVFIQKGLKFIDDVLSKKETIVKNDKKAAIFEPNEKMLLFYILFKEFDNHYSFILTTSQLKLITRLESGVRTDIRSEFDEIFIKFNEIGNFVNEYIQYMEEFHRINNESLDTPMQRRAKFSNLAIKRSKTLNELKARASIFFKLFADSLQKLINDYKNEKLLLQNPDDLLSFQLSRDKNRFDNVPIIKAIAAAFSFTSALHYYITFDSFSQKSLYNEENNDNDSNYKIEENNGNLPEPQTDK